MNKKDKDKFIKFCYSYANRFIDCVCHTTPENWLSKFASFRAWRCF